MRTIPSLQVRYPPISRWGILFIKTTGDYQSRLYSSPSKAFCKIDFFNSSRSARRQAAKELPCLRDLDKATNRHYVWIVLRKIRMIIQSLFLLGPSNGAGDCRSTADERLFTTILLLGSLGD